MDPITQAFIQGAAGVAGGGTYVDEVFNTKTYRGNATERSITTGIDLAGEGGLIWFKNRDQSNQSHRLVDTTALPDSSSPWYSYVLQTNSTAARGASANGFKSFNSDGFTIQTDNSVNGNNDPQVAWSFRKAKGFFDIVTYTGTGSARTVSHNLGSIPGCIIVKRTDGGSEDWVVYHRGISDQLGNNPGHYYMYLNETNAYSAAQSRFNNVAATSTEFSVGTDNGTNGNASSYVAYLFAGGESTAATAKCVEMDGTGDYFTTSTSSDYTFGTGDFTVETWLRIDEDYAGNSNYPTILDARTDGSYTNFWVVYVHPTQKSIIFYTVGGDRITSDIKIERGHWYHIAVVRNSGETQLYVNGISQGAYSDSTNYSNTSIVFGSNAVTLGSYVFDGAFSNLRVVKGTAVYTTSFKPPTAPLTNITNTKLLCFNDSSTTGTTVGTITASGNPTASTKSPFDDPEGFKFGEGGNQNIVKCGSYIGNGSSTGPEIDLGFEPQWVMAKRVDAGADWLIWDIMRGISTGGTQSDPMLYPNEEYSESYSIYRMDLTPRGFKITSSNGAINANNAIYSYIAIRRPDPLVGKPAEAGTEVFAIDNDTNVYPDFRSTFPVDYAFAKEIVSNGTGWWTSARLIQGNRLYINEQSAQAAGSTWCNFDWGDPDGWSTGNFQSTVYSWMFKRHAGFDVVTYRGTGTPMYVPHNLNAVPEMMWVKSRTQNNSYWGVYHIGLDAGNSQANPENWRINLHNGSAETQTSFWNNFTPTSEVFSVGNSWTMGNGEDYIAMLFTSITGISKVGYYTGNGSSITITTGFQPRFLFVKNIQGSQDWYVLDTTRGWGAGNDKHLSFNTTAGQGDWEFGTPTSTGFSFPSGNGGFNGSNESYLYYAHA